LPLENKKSNGNDIVKFYLKRVLGAPALVVIGGFGEGR